ncbi:SLC44A5 family protein [Megaselia abdita]
MGKNDVDPTKYGEPILYDRKFKGPLSRRSCTDIPCLIIFLAFLGAWGYIASYAFKNGDLDKLLKPTDSLNRKCGIDSSVTNEPYLFFFDLGKCIDPLVPITGCPTPQVCVRQCPSESFFYEQEKGKSFDELRRKLVCLPDVKLFTKNDIDAAIRNNQCASWYIPSKPFLNRCMWEFSSQVCEFIPSFLLKRNSRELQEIQRRQSNQWWSTQSPPSSALQEEPVVQCENRQKLGDAVIRHKMEQTHTYLARFVGNIVAHVTNSSDAAEFGQQVVEDINNSWFSIFLGLLAAMVASLIFIVLMRWIAAPILWFSILGALTALGVGIYYVTLQYVYWKANPIAPSHSFNVSSKFRSLLQDSTTWLVIDIVLAVVFLVIFLMVVFLRKRIVIAIALVKEGSKAVSSMFSTVFFPILPWALYILAIGFAVATGLFLLSIGSPHFKVYRTSNFTSEVCACSGPGQEYNTMLATCDPTIFRQNCVIQGTSSPCVSTGCFFDQIVHPPLVNYFMAYNVVGFIWIAFFISALGDMVLAGVFATWYWSIHKSDVPYFVLTRSLFRTIFFHVGTLAFGSLILTICRVIRLILEYIDAKLKKYDNAFTRAILCCMKCFFWCLESFLKFMNKNAYIMCAIHGKNFCSSAGDAFNLLMRNFLRVIALDKVTDFLFFLSKLFLTAIAGAVTYFYVQSYPENVTVNFIAVPVTIVVIGTFLITTVFFGVYSMAVDTLFLCFLEDIERNDGSEEKPYLMSKSLKRILNKRNVIPKNQYR